MMETKRIRLEINGTVQGVGFRPTVYRHAKKHNLYGFVKNSSKGVEIEVQGPGQNIYNFVRINIKTIHFLSDAKI